MEMAFTSMIRRVSVSVVPLSICAGRSQRTLNAAISSSLNVKRSSLCWEISRQSFLPRSRFSTVAADKPNADERLIGVLESEIECAKEPTEENIPDGFPFEIQDNVGERTIWLTRQFQDEIIRVEVDMPSNEDDTGDDDVEDSDDHSLEFGDPFVIQLVVSTSKRSGQSLEFDVIAFPDEIIIDSLSIKYPASPNDQPAYDGPDFKDLDENLQKAFYKYLEVRGIKPSTLKFLFGYMANKDNKEYLVWLRNLKNFIEK